MRSISTTEITEAVANLCKEANYCLGNDVLEALQNALKKEVSLTGKSILEMTIRNAEIARTERMPLCQDTGLVVVFLELGQDVHLEGGDLGEAINEGVRRGYQEGSLRKSVVQHPLKRVNTGDNTPAIVHVKIVPGDHLKLTVMPKGGGGENVSAVKFILPSEGVQGVKRFILEQVYTAGANPCPPVVVGVGIGGNLEKCALLAKEALLRPLGEKSKDPDIAELEEELLGEINNLGIGPQGLGGKVTALAVNIETHPTHIACLPVAVNLSCHSHRHKSILL